MNGLFDQVEMKMIDELMKRGAITKKRYTDKKKYIKDVVRLLYINEV